ncbi:MAG: PQQ-binding-like beta-propeller repeat protein [Candidatus Hinthialibacter antarcticus]|nr:PQQ-binding-like beta-propeller repeat protein [Candidatus Hinthialibacter antarcticus]
MKNLALTRNMLFTAMTFLIVAVCLTADASNQWDRFRGPNGSGVAEGANPPVEFGADKNLQWKAELPKGQSSPVMWNDKIFITGFEDSKLITVCIDRKTGNALWKKAFAVDKVESHHSQNSPASSSPAVDSEHVYIYFGSYGMLCYDHDGAEVWTTPVRTPMNMHGTATSPVLYKDFVYLIHDSLDGDSYLLALNKNDGSEAWKAKREVYNPNWSTPLLWSKGSGDELIVLGGGRLTSYDPLSGEEHWTVDGFGAAIPIPIVGGDYLLASTLSATESDSKVNYFSWNYFVKFDENGDQLVSAEEIPDDVMITMDPDLPEGKMPAEGIIEWVDRDQSRSMSEEELTNFINLVSLNVRSSIKAVKSDGKGKNEVVWKYERSIPYMPSSIYVDGLVYLCKAGGVVTCLDAKTGEEVYRKRLGVKENYSSSPVSANGRIYISSQAGKITAFTTGREPEVLGTNDLGEGVNATPMIADDAIYVRTETALWAFGK